MSLGSSAQSNFQRLTPSFILDKGVFEGKVFNDLYTQTGSFDPEGMRQEGRVRQSFLTSIGQFLYGVGGGVNLGIEAWGRTVKVGPSESSPFHILNGGKERGMRSALSYLGPRIKFQPVPNWSSASMELTLLAPVAPDLESRKRDAPFLADDRYSLILKAFYDRSLTDELRLFVRLAPWMSLDRRGREGASYFSSPLSVFFSYIPHPRFTLYSQSEYWPTYGRDPLIASSFFQQGIGLKYMLLENRLEGELLYSRFLYGTNSGAGQSFDLGVRLLLGK
jgi:hypothetical protein